MGLRFILFVLVVTIAAAHPPPDLQARLDAFVRGKPGGIAAAWVDRDGVAFFNAGKISAHDAQAISSDTEFEIGSLTKIFTALLLVESERAGKVSRSEPAARFLLPPGDPDQAKLAPITLGELATHNSGLPRLPADFPLWRGIFSGDPYANLTRADLVKSLRREGRRLKSNTSFAYSNFGFAVLGEALAAAWETTYEEALQAHVLEPLGLTRTALSLAGRPAPAGFATPHAKGKPVTRWTQQTYAPCGALCSSTRDLAKFLQAALGGDDSPLHAAFVSTTKPQRATASGMVGLGWMVSEAAKPPVIIWHNGGTAGSRSFLGFNRARGAGIVILTNHDESVDGLGVGCLRTDAGRKQ